jgi:RES domain
MSSTIWTECAGDSEIRPLVLEALREVESQHQIATRKLVDTDAEQQVLEELIESVKPPDVTRGRLHYLLFTPFRYPPLRHGSRFGTRAERGIWYGSESRATAFSEVSYYRLLFLEGTTAKLPAVEIDLTVFRASIRTARGVDLSAAPFAAYVAILASPSSYDATQALGSAMRSAGVEAFRYVSARDLHGGINIAVFEPVVFGRRQPRSLETWRCTATRERVEMIRRDYFQRGSFAFPREQFLVDGVLPAPAV